MIMVLGCRLDQRGRLVESGCKTFLAIEYLYINHLSEYDPFSLVGMPAKKLSRSLVFRCQVTCDGEVQRSNKLTGCLETIPLGAGDQNAPLIGIPVCPLL